MRLTSNEYLFENFDFNAISEVYLLKHFQGPIVPNNGQVNFVTAVHLSLNEGNFETKENLDSPAVRIHVRQDSVALRISCTCDSTSVTLCIHEFATLRALQKNTRFKIFFDYQTRNTFLKSQSAPYGLEHENEIEKYLRLKYEDDDVSVIPIDSALVPPDSTLGEQITSETKRNVQTLTLPFNNKRILIISRHRFYDQLRFEIVDTERTERGNLKPPFASIDIMSLLWSGQSVKETKFYAAINSFAQNYADTDPFTDLQALRAIQENPLNLPVFIHDREISEKITAKSLLPVRLHSFQGQIEIYVVKKLPFYEIQASFIQDGHRKSLHSVQIKHRYFLLSEDVYYLIDTLKILHTIEYFRNKPEKLLIHHSKYEEFMQSTLLPLEEFLIVNYTYIRKATKPEIKHIVNDQQRIVYFSHQGSYVNVTPIMRYGSVEVPLYSKRNITAIDANGNLYRAERDKTQEDLFLSQVMRMHETFPEQLSERTYFYLHYEQFLQEDWFLNTIEYWRNQGISVLGFQDLDFTNRNSNKASINIEILSGTKWFETKFHLQFGDQQTSMKQIYKSVRHQSKFIELDDGTIGIIPEEWLHKISRFFHLGVVKSESLMIPKMAFAELKELTKTSRLTNEVLNELNNYDAALNQIKKIPLVPPPKELKATLRKYQLEGLSWLIQLDRLDFGGCLADDMGLGKTVQIIAFLLYQKENRGSEVNLIICPTSLVFNWEDEIKRFAPNLKTLVLYGNERDSYYSSLRKYDVVITTYGLMVSDLKDLKKFPFNCIILDESQAIKNPNSERNKSAGLLQARTRYILTGTPIENNTFDLFGQLSFACPGLLGSKQFFKDTYATPIDRFGDKKRILALHKKIEPFILRRTKAQVATELPKKTEITILCDMGQVQRSIYESHQSELRNYLNECKLEDFSHYNMHMLAGLTRLRQICNAPYLLKDGYDKTISSKIEAMLERLDSIAEDHKVLIFSQFVGMLDIIKSVLKEREIQFEILTGTTKNRAAVVKNFNENPAIRIFLISLKAGGTGLNLTAADYVFLMDPWWNPATENQAIDRAHRLGQVKKVVAIRFICPDTVEEKIMVLQGKKKQLATDLIKSETPFLQNLDRKTWLNLLT